MLGQFDLPVMLGSVRRAKALGAAIFLSFNGSVALASCPSADDLETSGIWVSDKAGVTRYARSGPDTITEERYDTGSDDPSYVLESWRGLYLIGEWKMVDGEIVPGSIKRWRFDDRFEDLPDPEPGTSWSGKAVGVEGEMDFNTMSMNFIATRNFEIGGCAYDGVQVITNDTLMDGGKSMVFLWYLTDLGIPVLDAVGEPGRLLDFDFQQPNGIFAKRPQ